MTGLDRETFDACLTDESGAHPARRAAMIRRKRGTWDRLSRHAGLMATVVDLAVVFAIAWSLGLSTLVAALLGGSLAGIVAVDAGRRRQLAPSVLPVARPAALGAVTGFAAAVLASGGGDVGRLAVAAIAGAMGLLVARSATSALIRASRRRGYGLEPAIIVGAGRTAASIAEVLCRRPEFGLVPLGFVDDPGEEAGLPLPVLGPSASLTDIIRRHGVRRVVIAYGVEREFEIVSVLRASPELDVQVYVLPRFFEFGSAADGRATDELWGFPVVPLRRPSRGRFAWWVKRAFDVIVGGALLVLTAPIMAVVAVLVRASSPGPVLFRQERVGLGGRPYELLKFRSMTVNDDGDDQWSVDGDDRITPVGRVLRRTHLDELPQLWNVLRGDMALVGPRPERPAFVDRFSEDVPGYEDRHRVPTGLTGLAQVNGLWGDTSIEERARFDNLYIDRWSVAHDLQILFRTVPTLLGRRADDVEGPPPPPPSQRRGDDETEAA